MMNRSIDDNKDTTENTGAEKHTAKIYALNGEEIDPAAQAEAAGGLTAKIIAFNAPADTAAEADGEEPSADDGAEPADEAPLPDNVSVISREQLEQQTFEDSNDFFDEVSHRVIGVISSKKIEEAEDYDIFDEAEQLADGYAREDEKDETVRGFFKQIFGNIKRFFVHVGYFFTNLKRGIHQKRTAGKRKKAAEERRQRAAERRLQRQEEMESRRADNGLVQVRRRREHRDNDSR